MQIEISLLWEDCQTANRFRTLHQSDSVLHLHNDWGGHYHISKYHQFQEHFKQRALHLRKGAITSWRSMRVYFYWSLQLEVMEKPGIWDRSCTRAFYLQRVEHWTAWTMCCPTLHIPLSKATPFSFCRCQREMFLKTFMVCFTK